MTEEILDLRGGSSLEDALRCLMDFDKPKGATVKEMLILLLNSGWKHIEGTKDFMCLQKDVEGERPRTLSVMMDFHAGTAYFFDGEESSCPALAVYTNGQSLKQDVIERIEKFERGEVQSEG